MGGIGSAVNHDCEQAATYLVDPAPVVHHPAPWLFPVRLNQ